jgi:hypothetical protein
MPGRNSGGESD